MVSIVDAREKDVPALDDEFAKDTGKGETLADLRAALRKDLEARESDVIKGEARQAALKELVKRNPIQVASSLVERGIEVQYNRLRAMLGMQPPKRGEQVEIPDELRDKLRPAATDEVRGQLLLEAIADKENVAVTDAELDAHPGQHRAGPQRPGRPAARRVGQGRAPRQRDVAAAHAEGARLAGRARVDHRGRQAHGAGAGRRRAAARRRRSDRTG
jgi:hypothetical protein